MSDSTRESVSVDSVRTIFLARGESPRDKAVQAGKFITAALVTAIVLSRLRSPGFGAYFVTSSLALTQCYDWYMTSGGVTGALGLREPCVERNGLRPLIRGAQTASGLVALCLLIRLVTLSRGIWGTLSCGVGYAVLAGFSGWWVLESGKGRQDLRHYINQDV